MRARVRLRVRVRVRFPVRVRIRVLLFHSRLTRIQNSIEKFLYDAEECYVFVGLQKVLRTFEKILAGLAVWKKDTIIFKELCPSKHEKCYNYISPEKTGNIAFDETMLIVSEISAERCSLFITS